MAKKLILSPYVVTWVEFFPTSGIVTKHDRRLFGDYALFGTNKTYRKHFPTKDMAMAWLEAFDASKLDKSYTCYLFSDKQFGMATREDDFAIHYTKHQLANPFYLNNK